MERYVVGVDGGGTHLRVVVADEGGRVLGAYEGEGANPSLVGREVSEQRTRAAINAALAEAGLTPDQVQAICLGIAGAAAVHSAEWVRSVAKAVVPGALVVTSADYEIALAGANGRLEGVLIAAGTGSVAYGVSPSGETALAGGWGYLLGDEGSGYWLGLEALRAVARAEDGRGPHTSLSRSVPEALELAGARADLIAWLYQGDRPRQGEVSALAPLVLRTAAAGDEAAVDVVHRAAGHLAELGETVARRLSLEAPRWALSGGLLGEDNPLSLALCRCLGLSARPRPLYPPVIGAVRLALLALDVERKGEADVDRE